MAAKTEEEQIRVDLIEAEAIDMRTKWGTLCYDADFVSLILTFQYYMFDFNVSYSSYYYCRRRRNQITIKMLQ
jgi:hypothetical protein